MIEKKDWLYEDTEVTWCKGCGDYGLRNIMSEVYHEMDLKQDELIMVSGIGQAAKAPQYLDVNYFNGLHGRAIPAATAIKASNPNMTVVVESGDGDIYGEGGNHFLHAIRRNPDITLVVHDNMIYGLTKGQAAPTSQFGLVTPIQVDGVFEEPINPLAMAISLGATFVARGSVGEKDLTKDIIKQAINHKGLALVDVFQACVSFNKINTHKWFKDNSYVMDENYKPDDKVKAFEKTQEREPWPLGIFYNVEGKKSFEENLPVYEGNRTPLYKRDRDMSVVREILESKR